MDKIVFLTPKEGLKVDDADSFIRFSCENCGYKSIVSESYTGKKIRCPKCYNIISISPPESTDKIKNGFSYSDYDASLLDIHEHKVIKRQQIRENLTDEQAEGFTEQTREISKKAIEPEAKRKFPWYIDIFFYPFSKSGLKHLAIFIGVPLLIVLLSTILPIQLVCLFSLVTMITNIILYLYLFWYLAECVRDSADGWVRAPQGFGGIPVFSDMLLQIVNILGCFVIFFMPFVLYTVFVRRANIIFWLFLICAVFFFPMGLLSVVLHNSPAGFSLRSIFSAIHKTFLPYCGLIVSFITLVVLMGLLYTAVQESQLWILIIRSVVTYLVFIDAHLLGRFYWRYQDKLNWKSLNTEKTT